VSRKSRHFSSSWKRHCSAKPSFLNDCLPEP
jgi:hypothetical protein